MKKKGFTLIELVVVIALIAILAVTLAPRLRDQVAKAKDAKAVAMLGALRTNSQVFFVEREETVLDFAGNQRRGMRLLIGELEETSIKEVKEGQYNTEVDDLVDFELDLDTDGIPQNNLRPLLIVGGSRDGIEGNVVYGGTVGFEFTDAEGTGTAAANLDGLSLRLRPGTINSHDTKRKAWNEY